MRNRGYWKPGLRRARSIRRLPSRCPATPTTSPVRSPGRPQSRPSSPTVPRGPSPWPTMDRASRSCEAPPATTPSRPSGSWTWGRGPNGSRSIPPRSWETRTSTSPPRSAPGGRARVITRGIVGYSPDPSLTRAAFTLGGRLFVSDLGSGTTTELAADEAAREPALDPTGTTVAYVAGGNLRVSATDGSGDRLLAGDDDPDVVGASPSSSRQRRWTATAASGGLRTGRRAGSPRRQPPHPRVAHRGPVGPVGLPQGVRYPAAGTDNAIVTLHVLGLDGSSVEVPWDRERFPYLLRARWDAGPGPVRPGHVPGSAPCADTGGRRRHRRDEPVREDDDEVWLEFRPACHGEPRTDACSPPSPATGSAAWRSTASRSRPRGCTSSTCSMPATTCWSPPRTSRWRNTCGAYLRTARPEAHPGARGARRGPRRRHHGRGVRDDGPLRFGGVDSP